MKTLPLSLTIITLNEEKNIERCIKSVPFASEVIVVDSGSIDRTCEIAKSLGAKVIQMKWHGFGPQKQIAVESAANDWIISLDADEAISKNLANEILESFSDLDPQAGYSIPRKSWFLGQWINYGGWYPDYQTRLFNKRFCAWSDSAIHEYVKTTKLLKMKSHIEHFVFEKISNQVETNNKYSSLLAMSDYNSGKRYSVLKMLVKPVGKFIETYLLKLGFLDGFPGFVISIGAAQSYFLRIVKLREIESEEHFKKEKINGNI